MSTSDEFNPDTTRSAPSLDASSAPPGPTGPSAGQIPDLMKIGAAPVNTAMDVESDILDPVVFNENFARFRLQNKGILHSNSKLTFALDVSSTSAGQKNFFPLNIGVHSLIDRCVLKSGTKTICETSDFSHFMAFRSAFVSPQHNKQRESITSGRFMCRKWEYDDGANASSGSGAGAGQSTFEADKYTLDTGMEVNRFDLIYGGRDVELPPRAYMDTTKKSPVYQITLNDLFPFLKMNQLPLYMMKEELDIELYFTSEKRRACSDNASDVSYKLDRNECQMIADYIYYPQELMDAYAQSNSQMSFTYVDYRMMKLTVVKEAGQAKQIIHNLGGAGRIVNKLFYGLEPEAATPAEPQQSLFNQYLAQSNAVSATGNTAATVGKIVHNIKYNDTLLYPVDITNTARIFSNIHQSEGSVPFISKDEYSQEQDLISESKVNGYVLKGELSGKQFWTEDRLNRNERINSRGIELYQTWGDLPTGNYTLRAWLELVRFATLENGVLTPSWA